MQQNTSQVLPFQKMDFRQNIQDILMQFRYKMHRNTILYPERILTSKESEVCK